ncbi:unnamed protein product [Hyaloperonospora brassicae]|nr:unnamed protein product [Hyaloperonospora brassicae]
MEAEGIADSTGTSSVVADCLHIVNNMLQDNLMTQTLFLEMPYLESHVPQLLRASGIEEGHEAGGGAASERQKRVLKLGLQLVRVLVAELHEGVNDSMLNEMAQRDRARKKHELTKIQSLVARQEALMGAVGELICCLDDTLMDVRLQALDLLRLVSEHNGGAQMILLNMYALPSGRNVLADLVSLDVGNGGDESLVSAAASTLLDTLFHDNEGARMAVLQHIQTPPPPAVPSEGYSADGRNEFSSAPVSAGRVLLDAFVVNTESIVQCGDRDDAETLNAKLVVAWKAGHRLTNLLSGSSYCKELALRVPERYTDPQARAIAGGLFLSRCVQLLRTAPDQELSPMVQSIVFQAKLSVLLLLIHWCHGCRMAVREIVGSVANLSVLVDTLSAKQKAASPRSVAETTQLRGLAALLLGCCLEILHVDEADKVVETASASAVAAIREEEDEAGLQMTRDQLLQMISNRIGLEQFTNALVQFQQTAAILACARASATQSSRVLLTYRAEYDIIDIADANAVGVSSSHEGNAHYLFMLYERGFTIFYREMAERIQKRVMAMYTDFCDGGSLRSAGVDSILSTPASAYQDLIRMQDKRILDLQRQVEELKQREMDRGCQSDVSAVTMPIQDITLVDQPAAERERFEHEKTDVGDKDKRVSESAPEMEARMDDALALVSQQPEEDHKQREQEPAVVCPVSEDVQSSLVSLSSLREQLARVQAELDAEREATRRSRSEVASSEGITACRVLHTEGEAELARRLKQLEELYVECERKDMELAESRQMLEMLVKDQAQAKNDNERLKAQLAEALSTSVRAGEAESNKYERVIDGLTADNGRLESRVDELEVAARAVYVNEQEELWQRMQEAEPADPVVPFALHETALPDNETIRTEAPADGTSREVVSDDQNRSEELLSSQLEELNVLRARVAEMETVAKERDAQAKHALSLQSQVTEYNDQARRDKERYDATVHKLEDDLARALLEKQDAERKAKAIATELENEKEQLLLAKVELDNKLGSCHPVEGADRQDNCKRLDANRSSREPFDIENAHGSTVDDLLILVASLEIQCTVLRERLMEAQGEHAVAAAVELCRQRGAVVSL